MAMNVGSGGDEDEVVSSINTTPLVDVMLVLLIIFLITIPVVTHTVPVQLPKETNIPRQTKPENIDISVNKDGDIFWNMQLVRRHRRAVPAPRQDRDDEAAARGPHPRRWPGALRIDRARRVPVPARVDPEGQLRDRTTAQGLRAERWR